MSTAASEANKSSVTDKFSDLTQKDIIYASIVAFFAWMLAVYDYTIFGTLLPLMSKDFGWSNATTGTITTWVSVGVFFVSLTVGPIADYFGRKKGMVITCIGAALSSGLAGFSPSALFLIVVRALSGFGYSEQAVNSAYLNELYGSKRRGFLYSFVQGGWPIGVLFGAAVTAILSPFLGWREMFWFATFPAVVIAILAVKLKESPRFHRLKQVHELAKSGNTEEAKKLGDRYGISIEHVHKSTYRQLFAPDLRKQSIFLMLAFLFNWCGVMVFVILGTTIMTHGLNVNFSNSLIILIVSNIVTYIGYVFMGYLGDRIGRKLTIGGAWICCAIAYTAMLYVSSGTVAVLVLYTIGLFFLIGPYSALFTYMGESFPARVRGTGVSLINAMGPLGAILGAAIYTAVLNAGAHIPAAAAIGGSLPVLLGAILILMARTIKPGQELEDIAT